MAEEHVKEESLELSPCRVYRQLLSFLIDLMIAFVWGFVAFLLTAKIVTSTTRFNAAYENVKKVQLASSLYKEDDEGKNQELTVYLESSSLTWEEKKTEMGQAVISFGDYIYEELGTEKQEAYKTLCASYFLAADLTYQDVSLFAADASSAYGFRLNSSCSAGEQYYVEKGYAPFLEGSALTFLSDNFSSYKADLKIILSDTMLIGVPLGVFIGAVVAFYIIPLVFKRGRKSLGRYFFHIGLVSKDGLNLKAGAFTLYAFVFILFHFVLSLVSFGLPLLASLLMMIFTPKHQDFVSYFAGVTPLEDEELFIPLYKGEEQK